MDQIQTSNKSVFLVGALLSLQLYANVYTSYLQSQGLHRSNNTIQILMLIFRVGIGTVVVIFWNNVELFLLTQLLSLLISIFILRSVCCRHCGQQKISFLFFDGSLIKNNLNFIKVMAATSCVSSLLIASDRIMLMWLTDSWSFVQYSLALTLANLCSLVVLPFYRVYFPRFTKMCQLKRFSDAQRESILATRQLAAVLMPVSTALYFSSDTVFNIWIGSNHASINSIFKVLIIGMVMAGLLWLPAAYLQAAGRSSVHLKIMLISLIVGTVVTYFAIKEYGPAGGGVIWITHGLTGLLVEFYLIYGPCIKNVLYKLCKCLVQSAIGSIFVAIGSILINQTGLSDIVKLLLIGVIVLAGMGISVIPKKILNRNE